jgi:hypothetical protein
LAFIEQACLAGIHKKASMHVYVGKRKEKKAGMCGRQKQADMTSWLKHVASSKQADMSSRLNHVASSKQALAIRMEQAG